MPSPSTHPGMGAVPFDGGVAFRTWAPHANSVHVAGEFNAFSDTATPLAPEGNGHWSVDVPTALPWQKYKFVVNGRWLIDPRARQVTNSVGDGIVVDPKHPWQVNDFRMPPWNELVIYELHVATFPDNPTDPHQLFDVIAADLGYLKELGVNAIELLPAGEFPGDISWGYNPAHIFAVESSYGGPTGLKRFVDAAHAAGIAVIMDVVFNHLGPNDISVWQYDGWFERFGGDEMGGIYFYNDWRARTPWGHKNRPDYGRPEVRQYLRDSALMWLEEYRVDGLRFDMTVFIRNVDGRDDVSPDDPTNLGGWGWNLLKWINDEVNRLQPWKPTIAEDMQDNGWVSTPTSQGGAGFDGQWDAAFHHRLRETLIAMGDDQRDMGTVRWLVERRLGPSALGRVIFTESHDEVASDNGKRRLVEEIHPGRADSWESKKRSTLGAALVMTAPGIPMIFQGQEILEWTPFGARNHIDWNKYDQFRGIYTLYRDLIRLRRNWFDNTRGLQGDHVRVFHVNDSDKVIAFHRWRDGGPGDDTVVVLNFGHRSFASYTIGLPRAGSWRVRFNSDWKGYSDDFGNHSSYDTEGEPNGFDHMPCRGNVGIGPYTAIILSQ